MSAAYHRAILDALLAALRDGPLTTSELCLKLDPEKNLHPYLYPRTYARMRKLEGDGAVQRLNLPGGRVAWIRTTPPEPDDLEALWDLPTRKHDPS